MNPIGNIIQLLQPPVIPVAPAPAPAAQVTIVTSSAAAGVDDQVDLNNALAVKQALQPKAQIADTQVLGTGTEVTFMVSGQLYTRQTKIVDGLPQSTYIPKDPVDIKA